jgi:kynurenine formamidase
VLTPKLTRLKVLAGGCLVSFFGLAGAAAYSRQASPVTTGRAPVTKAEADRWATELSNWGRWGKDDQLGALNLVTPQKRQQAMALAKTGTVVSLEQRVVLSPKPEESKADGKPHGVSFYEIRFKTFPAGDPRGNDGFSSDIQEFHVHGGMTHLDALCHDSDNGKLYNGFPLKDTVNEQTGCTKLGLDNLKDGIVTRGILIDMTRSKGASSRAAGSPVYPEDIEAWEQQTGLKVSSGDALFAYNTAPATGRGASRGINGGFDLSVVPWLKARGVAVTSGVRAAAGDRHADHRLILAALGVYLLDGVELDRLSETAARLNRWEFMLVVAPPQVPGSTGAVVNPLAMF